MVRARLFLLSVLLLLSAAPPASAQEELAPVRAFRVFTREADAKGLPQSTVVALHEDAQGVIWIATMGGVAKVERGYVERLRALPDAPLSEPFNAFASRRLGGVHVAGTSGLFTWTGSRWLRGDTPGPLIALVEDGRGRLYGITTAGILHAREREGEAWLPVPDVEPFAFEALTATPAGDVVTGGLSGVAHLVDGRVAGLVCRAAPAARVRVLRVDASGTIWAGGEDGRPHFCASGASAWTAVDVPAWTGGRVRSMTVDRRQRIWIGGDRGEVAFGRADQPFTHWSPRNGVKGATVTSLVGDRTGGVWLGFNGAGLQHWVGESWSHRTFWSRPDETDSMFTFSLTRRPSGGFLAAVFSRGILAWDGTRVRTFGRAEGITEDLRFAIEPQPGLIWAGGRQSIFESTDGRSFRRVHTMPLGFVNGFFQSPEGDWWAATSNTGVLRRVNGRWESHTAINAVLTDHHVRQVFWRRNGDAWFATPSGIIALRGTPATAVPIVLPSALTAAYALIEVSPTEVWVAGAGGLAIGDGNQWRMLTAADGLPGTTMYSVARAADGAIWVGGSEGAAVLRPGGAWIRFDVASGLISDETNSHGLLPMPNGDAWVGTMSGLAHFKGDAAWLPPPPLEVFWRGDLAAGEPRVVTVPADDRRLWLEWMAPWPRPASVEYRTRIESLREAWSEPQTAPELRLERLPAGRFVVQVQARLPGDATWTSPIATTVVVEALWWETTAARVTFGVLALGVVGLLVQWRTTRLKRRAQDLEAAVDEAMANMKVLRGLLPICAHCKKIRDEAGQWSRLEEYIGRHSEADFSHGFCPDCQQTHYPELTSD